MASEWSETRESPDLRDLSLEVPSPIVRDMSCSRVTFQVSDWLYLTGPEVIQEVSIQQHTVQIRDAHVSDNRWERRFSLEEFSSLYFDDGVASEEAQWSRPVIAKMGDTIGEILAFVRCGHQILVETHSDHLVNALRTQVVFDPTDETRKLVKLIFAEQNDGITTYRESEINEYGGLSEDWPDGFLDISAKSAQDLVRQSLRKRIQRRGQGVNGES